MTGLDFLTSPPPLRSLNRHANCSLQPQQLNGLAHNRVHLREAHLLELDSVGRGDLRAGDSDSGGGQAVEAVLHGQGQDLGPNTEHGEARLDSHQAAGLLERLDNRLDVERLDGSQVDDLGLDSVLLLQFRGSIEREANTPRQGYDREILAGTLDLGLADRQHKVVLLGSLAHGEGHTVQEPKHLLVHWKPIDVVHQAARTRSPERQLGWDRG